MPDASKNLITRAEGLLVVELASVGANTAWSLYFRDGLQYYRWPVSFSPALSARFMPWQDYASCAWQTSTSEAPLGELAHTLCFSPNCPFCALFRSVVLHHRLEPFLADYVINLFPARTIDKSCATR